MLLIQSQNVKGNRPSFEEGRDRLEFVGFSTYHEAVRVAPVFDYKQDSVWFGVSGKRSPDACRARTLQAHSNA